MNRFYIVPIERVGNCRGPEYFHWMYDANPPSVHCDWGMIDGGDVALVVAKNITEDDHAWLTAHADVTELPAGGNAPRAVVDAVSRRGLRKSVTDSAPGLIRTVAEELLERQAGGRRWRRRDPIYIGGVRIDGTSGN